MKKQIIQQISVTGISAEGFGIGKLEDGKVVFVPYTAIGDEAVVKVTKSKKSYAEGTLLELVKPSADRRTPACSHFGLCGGCKTQHIPYAQQLRIKSQTVCDAFERIAKVELPEINAIIGCENELNYRNKLEFGCTNRKWLTNAELETAGEIDRRGIGFHVPGSFSGILDIQHCHLLDASNKVRLAIRDFALKHNYSFYNIKDKVGLLRNVLVRTTSTNEMLVLVSFLENDTKRINALMDFIQASFPEITSLQYVVNAKLNDTIYDLHPVVVKGNAYITEQLGTCKFQLGPKSFFQTNSHQAKLLYDVTKDFAGLTGTENVYDLYTGVGSIAIYVSDACKQVVGIEQIDAAIADAKENARLNNVNNAHFYTGDVRMILNEDLLQKHGKPDVIITDPPRAGMHEDVVKTLLQAQVQRLVYVSCNAATQARDAALLNEKYSIVKMQPVDMFPQTMHIENVALFQLR